MHDPISISFKHYRAKIKWMYVQLTRVCSVNFAGNNGRIVSHKLDQIE